MHTLNSVARYVESFSCDGPSCPDNCCSGGWDMPVDDATQKRWQTIHLHRGGPPLAASVQTVNAEENPEVGKWKMRTRTTNGPCVLLSEDKTCPVHAQLGEEALPLTCKSFPQALVQAREQTSMFLNLGCPQTARLALADARAMDMVPARQQPLGRLPPLMQPHAAAVATLDEFAASASDGIHAASALLADAVQRLIRTPELTAWQAWALFWQKASGILAALTSKADRRAAAELLRALQQMSRQSEGLADAARLAEENFVSKVMPMPERLDNALSRACDVVHIVTTKFGDPKRVMHVRAHALAHALAPFGLSNNPGPVELEAARQLYDRGAREWFEPFDNAHPHLLKNHLLNDLALRNFPARGTPQFRAELALESAALDALRVFLVGQALNKRAEFGIDDYVVIVQALTRHIWHPTECMPAPLNEELPCSH